LPYCEESISQAMPLDVPFDEIEAVAPGKPKLVPEVVMAE
jgi:hypothetical protein